MDSIVQFNHWLYEIERDASITVDIIDVQGIRSAVNKMQVNSFIITES